MTPFVALGWAPGARSGWGQFGIHFARTCHQAGYRVSIPGLDGSGVMPTDLPLLESLPQQLPDGDGWLFMPLGNGSGARPTLNPERSDVKVAGIIFVEDTGAIDAAALNTYDVIVAGSRWTERVLREKGVERVVLCHQGYDGRVFFPYSDSSNRQRSGLVSDFSGKYGEPGPQSGHHAASTGARPMIFSGGKLEFRKGQDIVVEAFKRFRATPEGKDAILVTNWQNMWPQTMDGIWLSGYVKGVPSIKNGRADIVGWLEANGLPRGSVIDCGWLSQPEVAQVMRSCTVAVFPNRAESGTNLPLVEAHGCYLPVLAVAGHGHDDVQGDYHGLPAIDAVPQGCPLYKSTEGWVEIDPDTIVEQLQRYMPHQTPAVNPGWDDYWDWSVRGPAIVEAVEQFAPVNA